MFWWRAGRCIVCGNQQPIHRSIGPRYSNLNCLRPNDSCLLVVDNTVDGEDNLEEKTMEVVDIMMYHSPQYRAEILILKLSLPQRQLFVFPRKWKLPTWSGDIGPVTKDFDHHPVQEAGRNLQRMCSSQKNMPARKKFRVQVERISHHGCILW